MLPVSHSALTDTAFVVWVQEDYLNKDHGSCDFVYSLVAGSAKTINIYDETCE